ncbi:MAG TPA: efflux RND transporter periplasmic adaptor subunit [Phycisphaerales bacterium]|nr:efflux RND transporter periplasmic adaptor subunit [Phycisphaerales bacterium]
MNRQPQRPPAIPRAIFALALCPFLNACDKNDKANKYVAPPPPEVVIANPINRDVTTYYTYTGSAEGSEKVELRARVQGFLQKIHFEPGQSVKAGDLLFTIEQDEYRAALDQAKAFAAASKAKLDLAINTLERAQQAFDQGGTTRLEVDEKIAARDEAKAALDLSNAKTEQAELDLQHCEVRSPIDGRVSKNYVDAGNLVGRGESTLLAEVVRSSPIYVSLDISEADVLTLRAQRPQTDKTLEPGQVAPGEWRPCELALANERDFTHKGRVDYVAPELDAQGGTLNIRTAYDNTDNAILPGNFCRVRFPISNHSATLVPEAALLSDQQGRFVMLVNEKDEVEAKHCRIGALDGTMRVVEEGLKPTDRVIVLGVLKARPGSKVTPKMQEPAAATSTTPAAPAAK